MRADFFRLMLAVATIMGSADATMAQDKTHIEIAGLGIGKKDPDSEFGQGLSMMRQPGLEVDVFFKLPGKTVLSIDNKKSAVVLSTADGKELPLEEMFDGNYRLQLNEEPGAGIVSLKTGLLPDKKTASLKLEGDFVFNVGADLKTADVELKLVKDSTVKFGPLDVTVSQVGDGYGDPYKQSFELSSKKSFEAIAKVEFLDAKGNVIESTGAGSGSFGFADEVTYSQSWQIASDAKAVKARISYFNKSESVKLPCKLEFGLGL
ncbi:MAG: hypothetical protein JNM43_00390 [Planctomycetaceae bacterium]|nr:hypothetical protein [Planctomycetaceae bacterium]